MDSKRFHSVRLDKSLCKGCTNCLTHCPTEAIRVRDGRAHIIDERCIDCGECIRICSYHAKVAQTDPLSAIDQFKYKIALPAPSLYGQFKGIKNVSQILSALRLLGFDDVFEVARGADVAARAIKEKLRNKDLPRPLISSACPAVTRLIQVRFPGLIPNIVDVRQPMEVAALMARKEFGKKHGVPEEEVGCFFITPCPAKMTAIRSPIGQVPRRRTGQSPSW
jgi:iron only hydrogenase large subunit-like protein